MRAVSLFERSAAKIYIFTATGAALNRSNYARAEAGRSRGSIMKVLIFLLFAILGMTTFTMAQKPEQLTLRHGQQKKAGSTGLTVKFMSVVEDSRCPVGVNCIWAGNAKIEVNVADARGSKKFVINTTTGPQRDQYGGWAIRLVSLSPQPPQTGKISPARYTATFSVERLSR